MKPRSFSLVWMLAVSSMLVALTGCCIKYTVILPLSITQYADAPVMALPFLYVSDPALRSLIDSARQPPPTTAPGPTQGETIPPTTAATAPTMPMPTGEGPVLDFPKPWVEDGWFDNTLFIGDSRVEGLKLFARSGNADYFCGVGLQVYSVMDKELEDVGFPKQTLESLLTNKAYDKIFICFGLNEAGYPIGSFQQRYQMILDKIRQLQPQAAVILHGILSVTEEKSKSADYLALDNLKKRNELIASFADGKQVFYVDVNPWFAGPEGYLYDSLTNDGCHPTVAGYRHWRDWLSFVATFLDISQSPPA